MSSGTPTPPPPAPYRAQRRRFAGPVILILLGVLLLFWTLGYPLPLGRWFALYWPVLIILWGMLKLLEYLQAKREGAPAPGIGAGGVFLLIILVICGVTANRMLNINWQGVRDNMDWGNDDFLGLFGNSYDYADTVAQDQPLPAGTSVHVVCQRGDVVVHPAPDNKIKVIDHGKIYASDQASADQIHAGSKPTITLEGNVATIRSSERDRVVSNLEIYLPKKAALTVETRHGDVNVAEREGDVGVTTEHGDVSVSDITGSAALHMRSGSVTVNHVTGDLSVDNRANDVSITDVGGSASLNGDFFGDIHLNKIAKSVRFVSSRTDLEFQKLDGDMRMSGDELHVNSFAGPFRLTTRSKEIRLEDFSGDVRIQNTNSEVSLVPGKLPVGNLDINNTRGKIYVELPAKAGFRLDAEANRGEITSDFDLNIQTGQNRLSKASATVGSGGPHLQLNTDRGDIEIHKAG